MPTGSFFTGPQAGTGQLTMGNVPGIGNIPTVGGGLTSQAMAAANMRLQGAQAQQAFMGDLIGAGAGIYGGYLAGGG